MEVMALMNQYGELFLHLFSFAAVLSWQFWVAALGEDDSCHDLISGLADEAWI